MSGVSRFIMNSTGSTSRATSIVGSGLDSVISTPNERLENSPRLDLGNKERKATRQRSREKGGYISTILSEYENNKLG